MGVPLKKTGRQHSPNAVIIAAIMPWRLPRHAIFSYQRLRRTHAWQRGKHNGHTRYHPVYYTPHHACCCAPARLRTRAHIRVLYAVLYAPSTPPHLMPSLLAAAPRRTCARLPFMLRRYQLPLPRPAACAAAPLSCLRHHSASAFAALLSCVARNAFSALHALTVNYRRCTRTCCRAFRTAAPPLRVPGATAFCRYFLILATANTRASSSLLRAFRHTAVPLTLCLRCE